ncbi:hypothetical protein [Saccharothrix sp. NRRL B-16314]|nr:hypothetical protein [Saccharothrix sp. NRRL B-16314]
MHLDLSGKTALNGRKSEAVDAAVRADGDYVDNPRESYVQNA